MSVKMSRFVIALSIVILFNCYNGTFGSPVNRGEAGMISQHEIAGVSTPTEQHYLHSMISELLTKVVIDPFKEMVTIMALYLEIFGVASGSHIIVFPNAGLSPQEDRELQLIAIASSNVWSKLPHSEAMNAIYINASKSVIPNILNNSSSNNAVAIVKELFKKIEEGILHNDSLSSIYKEERTQVEKFSLPMLANGTGNPDTIYNANPRFRNFIIRRQLLVHMSDDDLKVNNTIKFQRYALSQTVVQIGKTATKGSKMQEVLDQAVGITMDKIDPSSKTADPSSVIDEILFTTLEEKFKINPDLNDEFVAMKDNLIKKHKM